MCDINLIYPNILFKNVCVFLSFTASPAPTVGPMTLIFCMGIENLGLIGRFLGNQGQRSKGQGQKRGISNYFFFINQINICVFSGGIDKDDRPRVSYLRPGGIAHR